jgi:molybdopterin synthase sulfur carrier subunit
MPRVAYTSHLARFFPGLDDEEVEGATVAEVLRELERRHPGLGSYLVDERGSLRQHVSIFVGEKAVVDRQKLSDRLAKDTRLFIAQALSGG